MHRNVTIRLDEDLARKARIWAAQNNTSISRLVAELLREKIRSEDVYEAAMKDWLAQTRTAGREPGPLPPRDDLHDRASLR